jgi:hypothetical protein
MVFIQIDLQKQIESILNRSDIVSSNYGSETIQQLAEKIVEIIEKTIDTN